MLHWSMENPKSKSDLNIILFIECMFNLTGNVFSLNIAGQSGGAIYYDLFPPSNLKENLYINNQAKYGPNYASYPFKLKRV